MSSQEQQRHTRRDGSEPDDAAAPAPAAPVTQASTDEVDSILDEIDDVLESNAESFVRSFVQKGGQ